MTLDFLGSGEPSARRGEDICEGVAILSSRRLSRGGSTMAIAYEFSTRQATGFTREEKA
jgi:hypothetical protein